MSANKWTMDTHGNHQIFSSVDLVWKGVEKVGTKWRKMKVKFNCQMQVLPVEV